MKLIFILLLNLLNFTQNDANNIGTLDNRILNGKPVPIEDAPFMARMTMGLYFCAAEILSHNYLGTAGHCGRKCISATQSCTVTVGNEYYKNGTTYTVSDVIIHPDYDDITNSYDVAVLRICGLFNFGSKIHSIKLINATSIYIPDGTACAIYGWGVKENGISSDVLLGAIVYKVNTNACNTSYDGQIDNSMVCAAAPGTDTCAGDSGSPLLCSGLMVAVTSWGKDCGNKDYPGVYAYAYSDFIYGAIHRMESYPILYGKTCLSTSNSVVNLVG